ncbi:MAG: ATP-binding protein, partial [Bacteroidota bacterium]
MKQRADFIGRSRELTVLSRAYQSKEAEMVAVIGRRRVGKTYLIRHAYEEQIAFEMTGLQHGTKGSQLQNFTDQLTLYAQSSLPITIPENWQEAFQLLIKYLEGRKDAQKSVVFFDELPWIATRKSGFLDAFGLFWNSWASRNNVVVVICGSAASWMINKVVKNKGGLYNRITKRVFLKPFNLAETEAFLLSRGVRMDRYQILQLYMAMGGIPHYLKEVVSGKSAVQNIDDICFSEDGLLNAEFENLYFALFDHAEKHIA